ncbi:MAG: hypothetical protein ABJA83_12320 [Burkholderiaceae bacterium]
MTHSWIGAGTFIAAIPVAGAAQQDFPARQPIRLIVTFPPGRGADTIAFGMPTA